jgi:cation transport protein ChaC
MDRRERGERRLSSEVAAQRALLHAIDGNAEAWVFGYGSLLWNPGFDYIEKRPARLHGYHRAFCIHSNYYRGTAEQLGLVLGLDRGGCCRGSAFRLPMDQAHDILDYLWDREMLTWDREAIPTVYDLRVFSVRTDRGPVRCRTFVANRAHEDYAGRLPEAEIVRMIRRGVGISGSNREYLENTVGHLDELGIGDGPLHRLLRLVNGTAR